MLRAQIDRRAVRIENLVNLRSISGSARCRKADRTQAHIAGRRQLAVNAFGMPRAVAHDHSSNERRDGSFAMEAGGGTTQVHGPRR